MGRFSEGRSGSGCWPSSFAQGPSLKVAAGQFAGITLPQAQPPDDVLKKVDELVARLSTESYKDRQASTDELVKLGPAIAPLLRKHIDDGDPEVRHRIEEVIDKLGEGKPPGPAEDTELWDSNRRGGRIATSFGKGLA